MFPPYDLEMRLLCFCCHLCVDIKEATYNHMPSRVKRLLIILLELDAIHKVKSPEGLVSIHYLAKCLPKTRLRGGTPVPRAHLLDSSMKTVLSDNR